MFGQLGEVPDLFPIQNSPTVRFGVGKFPWARTGCEQQDVVLNRRAVDVSFSTDFNEAWSKNPRGTVAELNAVTGQPSGDVAGLRRSQLTNPVEGEGEVQTRGFGIDSSSFNDDPELRALCGQTGRPCGRHQRLAGHAVGQHRGAPDSVALNEYDVGALLCRHHRSLVATWPATDHYHPGHEGILAAAHPFGSGRVATLTPHGVIRGVRTESGSSADGFARTLLTGSGHWLARWLASDVRRRGPWLGRRASYGGGGSRLAGVRHALRRSRVG